MLRERPRLVRLPLRHAEPAEARFRIYPASGCRISDRQNVAFELGTQKVLLAKREICATILVGQSTRIGDQWGGNRNVSHRGIIEGVDL